MDRGRVGGKVALVTGGASGIGAATARVLVGEGASVVLTDVADGYSVAAGIGENARFHPHDVTLDQSWTETVAFTIDTFGYLDVLVNCAGIFPSGSIEDTTLSAWQQVLDVNLKGTFYGCRQAVRHMKDDRGGSIVNLSSVSGLVGDSEHVGYDASKGAVRLLTKSVALWCANCSYPIRCNSVHPGIIDTPMVNNHIESHPDPKAERRRWESYMAVGGMGAPEEVGYMILYLASDESRLVTGSELVIDGAETAR